MLNRCLSTYHAVVHKWRWSIVEPFKSALNPIIFYFVRKLAWTQLKPVYLVLIGPQGSGKGTLAVQLSRRQHLSTGDELRKERAAGTKLGKLADHSLRTGALLPDELAMSLVRQNLQRPRYWFGAILDGNPRNLRQARMLDELLGKWGARITLVVVLEFEPGQEDELITRVVNRRVCSDPNCARTYNLLYDPPVVSGVCDACQSPLYQREDDRYNVIETRARIYTHLSAVLCSYYRGINNGAHLFTVRQKKGMTKEEVFRLVKTELEKRKRV